MDVIEISTYVLKSIYAIIILMIFSSIGVLGETRQVLNDSQRIQDEIYNASPGDEIWIYPGEYHENLFINKSINITGIRSGDAIPIIIPREGPNAIELMKDGVILNAIKIRNEEGIAIACIYAKSDSNSITNMILEGAWNRDLGIVLIDNKENYIYNCTISNTEEAGISILNSTKNTISNNTISLCRKGIDLSKSTGNSGEYNKIDHCDCGIIYGKGRNKIGNNMSNTEFHNCYKFECYEDTIRDP